MKIQYSFLILLSSTAMFVSCNGQNKQELTYNQQNMISTSEKIALPENGFYCGFSDSKGNLWFGSRGNGVFKYNGKSFENFTTANGLCDNDVTCITEDNQGNLWFGTTSGVCKFNGKVFETLKVPYTNTSTSWLDKVYPVVNPNQVMSIYQDKKGDFWFGTNGAGVYQYNGKTFTQHLSNIGMIYDDGLYHNIILSIIEDKKDNIWFSSLSHGGVSVYDGEKFINFTDELSDDFIRVVFCDSKGNIWIGTHGNHKGGLDKFDGEQFTAFYKTDNGLSHNNVMGIYEDKSGLLWLASGTTELSVFDGKQFKIFKDNKGNTYDIITFIFGDTKDNIWFGNRFGLWKYDGLNVYEMTEK